MNQSKTKAQVAEVNLDLVKQRLFEICMSDKNTVSEDIAVRSAKVLLGNNAGGKQDLDEKKNLLQDVFKSLNDKKQNQP